MNRGNKAEYSGNEKWQKFKKEILGKETACHYRMGID